MVKNCNSNQKWNKNKCQFERKSQIKIVCQKIIVRILLNARAKIVNI